MGTGLGESVGVHRLSSARPCDTYSITSGHGTCRVYGPLFYTKCSMIDSGKFQ